MKLKGKDVYCYCNYGESGTMICCGKCNKWFHDDHECLGLSESEIENVDEFYCADCTERCSCHVQTKYKLPPKSIISDTFCFCRKGESDLMIECNKCKDWYHNTIKFILLLYIKLIEAGDDFIGDRPHVFQIQ